jgi:hypothetical protein
VSSAIDAIPVRKPSPYVGPRPFQAGELFYGREDESTDLMDKLLPGGVTLLHSPSGAGKTSLIQASVVPELSKQDFQICGHYAEAPGSTGPQFSALRVNLPPPTDLSVGNPYVFSVVNGLVGHLVEKHEAATMTIENALDLYANRDDPNRRQMIVLDQLEDILRLNPTDIEGQKEFFMQLGMCLRRGRRWALLAMREDYMGGLARFKRYFPNELRTTYRLDFLGTEAAIAAMQRPAAERGVTFADDATRQLIADLGPVRDGDSGDSSVTPPYVEPFLLQVVCESLWRKLSEAQMARFTDINVEDLGLVRPYDKILSEYYRRVVRAAVGDDRDAERSLRDWIEEDLISERTTRRPTRSGPPFERGRALAALRALNDGYLIRDEPRTGGTWWELSHEMLVQPIVKDNEQWRLSTLAPWQVMSQTWQRTGSRKFLLRGAQLREVRSLASEGKLSGPERAFLDESRRVAADEGRLTRLEDQLGRSRLSFRISLVLNAVLVILILLLLILFLLSKGR